MAFASHERYVAYQKAYYQANREKIRRRADAWREENRDRENAINYLRRLRKMKDPRHHHVRKMAEIAVKYPKRRFVLKF